MVSIIPLQPRDSELGAAPLDHRSASDKREHHTSPDINGDNRPFARLNQAAHLKVMPASDELRKKIKLAAEEYILPLEKRHPFTRFQLERHGRRLLVPLNLDESYLGFAMVSLGNAFWKPSFLSIPFARRLLLLPGRLLHRPACETEGERTNGNGRHATTGSCVACRLADFKKQAERLGYQVLEAERSPAILSILIKGNVDAILGIASLKDLEKSVDQVLLAGVPSYAIPLHEVDGDEFSLDESWVREVIDQADAARALSTVSYLPLIRAANALFTDDFPTLLPRTRSQPPAPAHSPLGQTEELAFDWLANGGKRFRPFITLAAYDALTGGSGTTIVPDGTRLQFTPAVGQSAMAIEAFHKASLVHDDIEDDDLYRYGRETLHRTHGIGMAINVGDYLIGLGYRLVNATREELGADVACDILGKMSAAHIKLCDGQGAEMAWQAAPTATFTPAEALQIYALKTAPAFEAALFAGVRMAVSADEYEETISEYCRHLGIGFQILNDLKDWAGDHNNKLVAGQDAQALRPTLLLALALQAASPEQFRELEALIQHSADDHLRPERFRTLFHECGVFKKARELVEQSRQRAQTLADEVQPAEFRHLLHFLVETVLAEEPTYKISKV
ncbi:MAG: polyprenyl synthetase family protein [Planctomycetaceae bacterium]